MNRRIAVTLACAGLAVTGGALALAGPAQASHPLPFTAMPLDNRATPTDVATAYLDKHGNADVVEMSPHQGEGPYPVTVQLGNGDGTFDEPVAVGTANQFFVGDFNGDGIPDLALTDRPDATLSILIGNGDGTFDTSASYDLSAYEPFAGDLGPVAVGDLNGDGRDDVVLFSPGSIDVRLGSLDGTLAAPVQSTYDDDTGAGCSPLLVFSATTGDVNGDGLDDVAGTLTETNCDFQTGVLALTSTGGGHLTQTMENLTPLDQGADSLALANLDGDSQPDLVGSGSSIANGGVGLYVRYGNGDGTFGPPVHLPGFGLGAEPPAIADFDGDGAPDIAAGQVLPSCSLGVDFGLGSRSFITHAGSSCGGAASADFNGDGLPDLALGTGAGLQVELNADPPNTTLSLGGGVVHTVRPQLGSTQEDVTFQCSVDGMSFESCSSGQPLEHLKPGKHDIDVKAINQDGVVDPSPASGSFTIEPLAHPRDPSGPLSYQIKSKSIPPDSSSVSVGATCPKRTHLLGGGAGNTGHFAQLEVAASGLTGAPGSARTWRSVMSVQASDSLEARSTAVCGNVPVIVVASKVVTVQPDSRHTLKVHCPDGTHVLSGNAATGSAFPFDSGDRGSLTDDGWEATLINKTGTVDYESIEAICSKAKPAYRRTDVTAGAGAETRSVARCPAGTQATGGGQRTEPTGARQLGVNESEPFDVATSQPGLGWVTYLDNLGSTPVNFTAYAICLGS